MSYETSLNLQIDRVLHTAVESKTFVEFTLEAEILVFPKALLDERIKHYGDNVLARTLDYTLVTAKTSKVRAYDDGSYKAKSGKKWLDVDYHYCGLSSQPCIYF